MRNDLPSELIAEIALHVPPQEVHQFGVLCKTVRLKALETVMRSLSFTYDNMTRFQCQAFAGMSREQSAVVISVLGFVDAVKSITAVGCSQDYLGAYLVSVFQLLAMQAELPPHLDFSWNKQGFDALLWAGEKGNLPLCEMLLSVGVPVDPPPPRTLELDSDDSMQIEGPAPQASPLLRACLFGHLAVVQLFLEHGADPTLWESSQKFCALNLAVQDNNLEIVKLLLSNERTRVDQPDYGQWTSLHWASELGNTEMAKLLMSHGAQVDAADEEERTCLHWACVRGVLKMVKLLLKSGANLYAVTRSRTSALHLAAANGFPDVVKFLISKHEENREAGVVALDLDFVNARDATNRTPLHSAAEDGQDQVCLALIQKGANISAQDDDGFNSLHSAVLNQHLDVVNLLLQHNPPLDAQTISGATVLHLAAAANLPLIIQSILARANADNPSHLESKRNLADHTPLHHACVLGSLDAVITLLKTAPPEVVASTADIQTQNTPLHLAIRFNHEKVVAAYIDHVATRVEPYANQWSLLNACLDYTIECFLSLRPYNSSEDRNMAAALVEAGATVSPTWDVACVGVGCGKTVVENPFYKCMICDTIFCYDCRERLREAVPEGQPALHDPTHGFVVVDKEQLLEFLLSRSVPA
ncbi:hypothetical protein HDU81_005583 [Chytriomyces hyalinus]|nr:hypothetical protein HDU81_005583 [Chytriomyces hyalinus]